MGLPEGLKYFRKQKKLTQTELADAINNNNKNLSNWENGVSKPDLETIIIISQYLGVSIESLIFFDGTVKEKSKKNVQPDCPTRLSDQTQEMSNQTVRPDKYKDITEVDFSDPKFNSDFSAEPDDSDKQMEILAHIVNRQQVIIKHNAELLKAKEDIIRIKDELLSGKDEVIAAKEAQLAITTQRVEELIAQLNDLKKQHPSVSKGTASGVAVRK